MGVTTAGGLALQDIPINCSLFKTGGINLKTGLIYKQCPTCAPMWHIFLCAPLLYNKVPHFVAHLPHFVAHFPHFVAQMCHIWVICGTFVAHFPNLPCLYPLSLCSKSFITPISIYLCIHNFVCNTPAPLLL